MAMVDITAFMQRQGIRKARFGGLEAEDVRLALQALAAEYESILADLNLRQQETAQANAGLEKHCQALSAQNRTLTDQVMTLAAGNEKFARQVRVQDAKNSELVTRTRTLTDQNAVLTLKNGDLVKENRRLQERAETAEATLNVRGRELEGERLELERTRKGILNQAEAEADKLVAAAKAQARRTEAAADANAAAALREARTQAQAQAQELVDSATSEANEIYNIHQLRVDSLKGETGSLEIYRQDLLAYLHTMGDTLLSLHEKMEETAPEYRLTPPTHTAPPELKPVEHVAARLDLSDDTLARSAARQATATAEKATPAVPAFVAVEPAAARPATSAPEPAPQTGKKEPKPVSVPGEVPGAPVGAIFSSPIVNPEPETLHTEIPLPGPRTPVMPVLPPDEEDDDPDDTEENFTPEARPVVRATPLRGPLPGTQAATPPAAQPAARPGPAAGEELRAPAPAPAPPNRMVPVRQRRAVAVRALRALRRSRAAHGGR